MNMSAEKEWLLRQGNSATTLPAAVPVNKPQKLGFKDVAGMEKLKTLITESFINVLNHPDCAKAYGIVPPAMLFYGPSGCGKTHFAEAIAQEVGIHFIKVVPDDIGSKWVHGTQQKIAEVFHKAERSSPTILFFDEFEAMVPARTGEDAHSQNNEVNEFLCMLNNASERGVYVIAATNHPENIDRAVLRTGRIDEMIYIDMPDKPSRESLFQLFLSKVPTAKDIDYNRLADLTSGYNCSDINYIVKVASRKMFNETIQGIDTNYLPVTQLQLEEIIRHRSPSVTQKDLREYERIRSEFSPRDEGRKRASIGFHD